MSGHCFVSGSMSVPVLCRDGKIIYISLPIGYRMWVKGDDKESKLHMAAGLVKQAMDDIGEDAQVILMCDSWYPKKPVTSLLDSYDNLNIICNVRVDTAMYELPPERFGKCGRPGKYGEKADINNVLLDTPAYGKWKIGVKTVLTNLFGNRKVLSVVTSPKEGSESRRLFLCTVSEEDLSKFDYTMFSDDTSFRIRKMQSPIPDPCSVRMQMEDRDKLLRGENLLVPGRLHAQE